MKTGELTTETIAKKRKSSATGKVGLAADSIRGRMRRHLDTPEKRKASPAGAPFWFYYVLRSAAEVGPIERGWMNQAIMEDGAIPLLNKVYSPL
jgi:hypothetical protein